MRVRLHSLHADWYEDVILGKKVTEHIFRPYAITLHRGAGTFLWASYCIFPIGGKKVRIKYV